MTSAFPDAPLYTALYEPAATFPEFAGIDVRPSVLNRVALLRRDHRRAFPFLAPTMSRVVVDSDVVVCSSSGWAHGVSACGRKLVYCHAPARWLYQRDRYVRELGHGARAASAALHAPLARWDRRAADGADRYVVNSSHVAAAVADAYGREAEVLPPPPRMTPAGEMRPVEGLEPGFALCVSRLLPYKNVDVVVGAFERLPHERLVVVGDGPDGVRLRRIAGSNVIFTGTVDDAELRWLYANAVMLVAASYEDYGLTPLEAASFGKPTAALRYGGFLDTVDEGVTGAFFDEPAVRPAADCIAFALACHWDASALARHAERYSEARFVGRLRELVAEVAR
jgi:glycosyltransferase involved in cell wall biosynthesis